LREKGTAIEGFTVSYLPVGALAEDLLVPVRVDNLIVYTMLARAREGTGVPDKRVRAVAILSTVDGIGAHALVPVVVGFSPYSAACSIHQRCAVRRGLSVVNVHGALAGVGLGIIKAFAEAAAYRAHAVKIKRRRFAARLLRKSIIRVRQTAPLVGDNTTFIASNAALVLSRCIVEHQRAGERAFHARAGAGVDLEALLTAFMLRVARVGVVLVGALARVESIHLAHAALAARAFGGTSVVVIAVAHAVGGESRFRVAELKHVGRPTVAAVPVVVVANVVCLRCAAL
jgi:hypothetical protein